MYTAKRPIKNKEACSGGNPKRGKTVEFNENTQEVNVMENCDNTIPRNKKGKKLAIKKRNIKSVKAAAAEKVRTYGMMVVRSNIDMPLHYALCKLCHNITHLSV